MEHASRGRRSGNKGVGARWRGRFRIFSARHRSRTEVSHAENSGMHDVVFFLGVAPVSGGVGAGARGGFNPLRGATTGVVIRRRATTGVMARGFWFFLGGAVAVCFEGCCGGGNAKRSFAGRIPKRSLGTTQRGRGAVAVCFEGCCGGMCWPRERPATHAAAGAAARGALIFLFWGVLSHAQEWMAREG